MNCTGQYDSRTNPNNRELKVEMLKRGMLTEQDSRTNPNNRELKDEQATSRDPDEDLDSRTNPNNRELKALYL